MLCQNWGNNYGIIFFCFLTQKYDYFFLNLTYKSQIKSHSYAICCWIENIARNLVYLGLHALLSVIFMMVQGTSLEWKECEICLERKSAWKCVDCKTRLCNKCKEHHPRFPTFRGHRITEYEDEADHLLTGLCSVRNIQIKPLFSTVENVRKQSVSNVSCLSMRITRLKP